MRRRPRTFLIVCAVAAALIVAVSWGIAAWRHSQVADELALAQPFLELDAASSVKVDEYPASPFDTSSAAGIDAVVVVYETDDVDALVDELSQALAADGWTAQSDTLWVGPSMASITLPGDFTQSREVQPGTVALRIGAIEG